jgi:PTS system nitrogen regulatory IIA component
MQLIDILGRERVLADIHVTSKKRLIEKLAHSLSEGTPAHERQIFESLVAREHLGSTGLGGGIAIPHGRCKGDFEPLASFIRLKDPVEFDAPDGEPVDLVLGLIVPEHFTDLHLSLLAQVAELFSHPEVLADLRAASSSAELFQKLKSHTEHWVHA